MTPTNPTPVKPADIKPGMKVRMLHNWWEEMPDRLKSGYAFELRNKEFAPGTIHLVAFGPDKVGDCHLRFSDDERESKISFVNPSCFEVIPETPSQPEDLSTWPATRGPEWRRMGRLENIKDGDVMKYSSEGGAYRLAEPVYQNLPVDCIVSKEAWTKRPAPTQEKPPEPVKPSPKPTKTDLDLAEAEKRVKLLQDLKQVEAQIKAHKAAGADLRAKLAALKADIYYTRPWAKQAKAVAKKDKKKS